MSVQLHVQHLAINYKSTMKYIAVYYVTSDKDSRLEVSVHVHIQAAIIKVQ